MTMFKVEFDTDNDAFGVTPEAEIARILRKLADRVEYGASFDDNGRPVADRGAVLDVNGNSVGRWMFTPPGVDADAQFLRDRLNALAGTRKRVTVRTSTGTTYVDTRVRAVDGDDVYLAGNAKQLAADHVRFARITELEEL